jgi:hypothetical protein
MTNLYLERVINTDVPTVASFDDHSIFQTIEWMNFISSTQNAEPVIAVVKHGKDIVGRFTGLIIRKFGIRILGSPFPGWTTSYMGFNLLPKISRTEALLALTDFAFHDMKCFHFEMMDRHLSTDEVIELGYQYSILSSFELDLTKSEDELFSSMHSSCRRCIRKANKIGLQIEESKDINFIDEYYAQLEDVFAKQNLVPTYSKDRVEALLENLLPSGNLLLLRAVTMDGVCIGTGIFPALNGTMYFWGGASYREHQILRPNEAIQWCSMLYWKNKGISKYDMGGSGTYKKKY